MAKAYSDVGIELRIAGASDAKFPALKLVEIKSTPATGQAGGNLEVTTHSDATKVYIPDRPDTGDMDFTYNYTAENLTAVKAICDGTEKQILIKYPDGTGVYYKGICQTWRNEVSVGSVEECTLHTVPATSPEEKTVEQVTALINSTSN